MHLARSTPPSLIAEGLEYFDNDVRHCFALATAVDTTNSAWKQAQLSLSRGGLGLCRLSEHSSACYIASLSMVGMCSETNQHLLNAIDKFNEHVSNEDTVTLEAIRETPCRQKVLLNKLDDSLFAQLFSKSSLPDRARLLSVSSPHAAAWLSTAPSPGLNLQLEPSEFQAAIQWWLGVSISGSQGATCPHCPAHSLDPLGHHALTCKHGGDVVIRYNRLRDGKACCI